jgi:uncharacterized protein YaaR (DUF327 family)
MTMVEAKQELAEAVENLFNEEAVAELLDSKKADARSRRERDDYLWHRLVASFATLGNSAGAVLIKEEENYNRVRYEKVREMEAERREEHFEQVFRDCNVRYPERKADYLTRNVDKIEDMGGLEQTQKKFEEKDGFNNKIEFLKQFLNIGEKYSRNILMDLYHPDARDQIAIDSRIQNISEKLGVEFDNKYPDEADFYRDVADMLEIEPWELDRTLYNFNEEVESRLS